MTWGLSQMIRGTVLTLALLAIMAAVGFGPAHAQVVPKSDPSAPSIPAELTPDQVDGLLARMTDADIRALLREELVRRAEQAEDTGTGLAMTVDQIGLRLEEMGARIQTRVMRWSTALANIGDRGPRIRERLSLASDGPWGMLVAGLAVLAAGMLAAYGVIAATRFWRGWLKKPPRDRYWDKVLRTLALGVLELLPVFAFVAATRLFVPLVSGPLGPLNDYLWIYTTGVSYSWAFIVFTRRAFAPDAPLIRIAPLTDALASSVHRLLALAVCIGAAAWLGGGIMFHLGLGFPPIMVTRALAGTAVAALLLIGLWRKRAEIQEATAQVFGDPNSDPNIDPSNDPGHPGSTLSRMATATAPWLLGAYIVIAWAYWLAHWLETGRDRLEGPVGTLIVYLALPIVDRMGRQVIGSLIRRQTAMAERFRHVLAGAWRLVLGIFAAFEIVYLWGLDLLGLAKGPAAPLWASTVFDVAITLVIGWLIWRLIRAALYSERRVSDAAEDVDPSSVPSASRLDTLVPLFRNFLLGALVIVVAMMVLSAMGMDIAPLIASAGIIGIAIGFGAQNLVRDIFSGIFFLVDDAFRVGEYIELDADTRGEVETISVRSMQLRHHRGPVITIPFGELKQIMNHNRDWVIYKMSFRMEPETDPQRFKKVVKEVGKEFLAHPEHGPKFIEPVKSQGVYYVDDDSALVMRVKFKCKPRAQFVLRREIYHRLRVVFEESGLNLARRKVEVVGGDGEPVAEDRAAAAQEAANAQAGSAAAGGG